MSAPRSISHAEAAQHIARTLGPVLPLCYVDEGGACACGGKYDRDAGTFTPHTGHDLGKAPLSRLVINGVDDATKNSAKIDLWFRRHPKANVGLALKPARVIFIDPDSPDALTEATTLGVDGGMRRDSRNVGWLFKRPDDCPVLNISKSADKTDLEIRTDGYAVVWGVHANGSPVHVDLSQHLQGPPAWPVDRLKAKAASKAAQDDARAARRAERESQEIVGDEPLWLLDDLAMERWNGTLYEVDSLGNLDRSRSLYRLGCELAEAGASEAGIRWAVENRDAALGWNKYTDRDDSDDRYQEIAEKVVADVKTRGGPKRRGSFTVEGSDGAETCRGCTERDRAIEAMGEQLREHKAESALLRSGTIPAAEALVLSQLTTTRKWAQSKGEELAPIYVPDVARLAGVGDTTVTRAFNQVRRWQADPEIAATLPFRVEEEFEGRKSHLRLRVVALPDEEPGRSRSPALTALLHLPRDEGRAKHGGSRLTCPKHPDSQIVRTRIWRCTEEGCTWGHQDTATLGGSPDQDGPVESTSIYGASFFTELQAASEGPDQDGPHRYETCPDQDGPAPLVPVSFVTRDDAELFDGRRLRLVEEGPARTVDRPKPWRCHCGSYERYPRQSGGYRCDGCGDVTLPAVSGAET